MLDATHRDLYPEHEAERILMGLGFSEVDFAREVDKLSGGYRMRVALAHLLLTNPDVLMLDEPTNHLDKPTQRWFEQFLLDSEMTLLLISHDTAFLDRVVTSVIVAEGDGRWVEYAGGYSDMLVQRGSAVSRAALKPAAIVSPRPRRVRGRCIGGGGLERCQRSRRAAGRQCSG